MKRSVDYFDTIAKDFKSWINPFDLSSRLNWFGTQLDKLDLGQKPVLDVGCGLGYFSKLAADRGGKPVALDFAGELLEQIKDERIKCIKADALELPFSDGEFPFVISSECIEHTPDPLRALGEMMRVLAPGGTLICSMPNYAWRWAITASEKLNLRKFRGIENWLRRGQVRDFFIKNDAEVLAEEGLFILPFQIKPLWPLISWFNRHGQAFRKWMINQCWMARKKQ